jgi:pimeloyl-ACP methyl ester carboxylesterase
MLTLLLAAPARAEVGNGISGLFTVDTRYGFSLGAGISGFFTVDTRHSGWSGEGMSGLFPVDTRGAMSGTAIIAGRVTASGGAGLSGATVSALVNSITWAHVVTDSGGYFTLASLPAATYELRVRQSGYLSGVRYGLALAQGQGVWQDFALAVMPAPPVIVPTNRLPDLPAVLATSQLKRFVSPNWVIVTSASDIDRTKPTVVLTHGWNSSSDYWPSNTAASMLAGGVTDANLLAWDWRTNAGMGLMLSMAFSNTRGESRLLAQTLTNVLGLSYGQGIHFIGHSLGTLVNAAAANYLHNQTGGAFDYRRTQVTLLDNAELVNSGGRMLPLGYSAPGFESVLASMDVPLVGWASPLPEQRAWADNYISLVGLYHSGVVNVEMVVNAVAHHPLDWIVDAHGYACSWYAATAQNPDLCSQLGHRYSFERLGADAQFPSPTPYAPGVLFIPSLMNDYSLVQIQDPLAYHAALGAEFARSSLLGGLSSLYGFGESVGSAAVDVVESAVDTLETATSWIVAHPISSLRATLRSVVGLQPKLASGLALGERQSKSLDGSECTNSPSAVWLPVEVPTNAALFSFDFTFTGDAGQDLLSASLNGTNVFALEAQDMPAGQVLNSGPIDVSAFAGKTVELFFGLLGGTSTNATLAIAAMRFYQIDPPLLTAEKAGTNIILSWSAMTTGYTLEASPSLTSPSWITMTNVPTLSGMRQSVTNSFTGQSQFYRLRRD